MSIFLESRDRKNRQALRKAEKEAKYEECRKDKLFSTFIVKCGLEGDFNNFKHRLIMFGTENREYESEYGQHDILTKTYYYRTTNYESRVKFFTELADKSIAMFMPRIYRVRFVYDVEAFVILMPETHSVWFMESRLKDATERTYQGNIVYSTKEYIIHLPENDFQKYIQLTSNTSEANKRL